MPRLGNPRKQQQWLQHLQRWQRSGVRVRDYCQRRQLSEASFYFWKRTLRQRGLLADTPGSHQPPAAKAALFVPIAVHPAKASAGYVDLLAPDGWTVRLNAGFDVDSLRQLLAVLRERSC